jgi:hypothetical protein
MRKAVAPRIYSVQLSSLANIMRTVEADKRITPEKLAVVLRSINDITAVLSDASQKPLPLDLK